MENEKNNDGFIIHVNSPGNFIAKEITISGTVNINGSNGAIQHNGFTDEQIAQALSRIVGKGKAIDTKQKWAGAHWLLRWECNYPSRAFDFCERINSLPMPEEPEIKCDYNNIRQLSTLSFMNEDPRQMELVKYSKNDEAMFFQMREVVYALQQELHNLSDMEM